MTDVRLEPMTEDQYKPWRAEAEAHYARSDVRRRGYGRAIMLAAERWCHDNALRSIGLRVFAHNTGARALYEQLGFTETSRNMTKDL
ncbi:N-acetyltransferase [Actinoplanes sp. ATCC 53533]|uniref:GNAT family N-acetyltransferase n=1 Tax=Actinoplanes sp. ATCC 53533 TaxID=1288362 RepID=UPI000F79089D|nr:GNAT family N-acetyltransferase [Actinoplanes sp. ATCC 53533]